MQICINDFTFTLIQKKDNVGAAQLKNSGTVGLWSGEKSTNIEDLFLQKLSRNDKVIDKKVFSLLMKDDKLDGDHRIDFGDPDTASMSDAEKLVYVTKTKKTDDWGGAIQGVRFDLG